MSKLYAKLGQLQRELVKSSLTSEEREEIEDMIAELEDEIEIEESGKYSDREDDR